MNPCRATTSFCVAAAPSGSASKLQGNGFDALPLLLRQQPFHVHPRMFLRFLAAKQGANRSCQTVTLLAAVRTSSLVIGVPS